MKIDSLKIENFRGIRLAELSEIGGMVVIAGQNGSGKSCLFDAIRLLKSAYGGYQQNEWHHWMGEFQIQLTNRSSDFVSMFNQPTKTLSISCEFCLSESEKVYIKQHANELVRETVWRSLLPEAYEWGGFRMASFATQFREREPEVTKKANERIPLLLKELDQNTIRAACFIEAGSTPQIVNSVSLSVLFSTFRPQDIGVIDYHGAQRNYNREILQGINLNLDAQEKAKSQHALYNYGNKYANVKSELASSYIKEILAEQAGVPKASQSTLTNTLKELFRNFFPDKEFLGPTPTPTGTLQFPVRTPSGNTHDLDELSAGEKEILYGYLRIRNSAPQHSIILLDEPELHLNPRLIRGLPQFYQKHLGEALDNQLWLVTHSDALLREIVGREKFSVFHMLPCGNSIVPENQIKPLRVTADLELALVDLVGDLAAYRPGGKVVIFEGGGDSDFDRTIVGKLFPELQSKANLISGSNRARVRGLHELLEKASSQGALPFEFYSVTDRDSDNDSEGVNLLGVRNFSWNVYHIENYFLEPLFLRKALTSISLANAPSEQKIEQELKSCAKETLQQMIKSDLIEHASKLLIGSIDLGFDSSSKNLNKSIGDAIDRSLNRINSKRAGTLSDTSLTDLIEKLTEKYSACIKDNTWKEKLRGRDVLKRFAGKYAPMVKYEIFRNLVISKMQEDGFQPQGMAEVVAKILKN